MRTSKSGEARAATLVPALVAMGLACGAARALAAPVVEIPLEIRSGLPTTEVRVSGQPLALFLDLGAYLPIGLTAAEMALGNVKVSKGSDQQRNSSGTILESRRFVAADVVIGGRSFGDLEGGEAVYPRDQGPPDRNGYIGFGFLGRYLLVLDYPGHRARLYASGDREAFERECGKDAFPLDVRNGVVRSTVRTEIGDLTFAWDTGTTHNFLRPAAFKSTPYSPRTVDDGPPAVTLSTLSIGRNNYGPLEFRLLPFAAPDVDGMLGAGLFERRKVCLDVPEGRGAVAPVA
jgi:hypothetical protein